MASSPPPPVDRAPDAGATDAVPEPVRDEEKVLARVLDSLRAKVLEAVPARTRRDYDLELVALRDQIAEARLEDAPPLIAQMERLQAIAARRTEVATGTLDARSPYFAHLRLVEGGRTRDVCLGRTTYLDSERSVRVVDWRNAPVSRIYYRYQQGDSYEESFGDRDVEGEVVIRRDVTIADGRLVRVGAYEATYVRTKDGAWRSIGVRATRLAGGQGTAVLPTDAPNPERARGVLGEGHGEEGIGRRDRFLPEIAALLDPSQFDAISRPAAGVVVIQGGAGSGKTTIGLHRIAYLAYQAPKRFTSDRMIVLVPSRALATYTSRVLPSLEVPHVPVLTLSDWQREARRRALPALPARVTDETPLAAIKLKKHPALLALLERRVDALVADADASVRAACDKAPAELRTPFLAAWDALADSPIAGRLAGMRRWVHGLLKLAVVAPPPSVSRTPLEHAITQAWRRTREVPWLWAELLTDRQALLGLLDAPPTPGLAPLTRSEIEEAHRWCTRRCEAVIATLGGDDDTKRAARQARRDEPDDPDADARLEPISPENDAAGEVIDGEPIVPKKRQRSTADDDEHRPAYRDGDDRDDDDDRARHEGVDGRAPDEDEELGPALDAEDDALLLRLHQRVRGPLHGKGKTPLQYEHAFVDEVQDCAAIDLALLVECVVAHPTRTVSGTVYERSMTLAGDVAQRLTLDTGLGDFAPALERLGLPHVEVEPLTIGYRSTRQVLELARQVLGPLAPAIPPVATRDGAPVELHTFGDPGAAASFLAAALRDLSVREPMASIALVTRHPWQADVYHEVLVRGEVPNLRRIGDQDFPFRAGVDVTDVRQVKGLEWDYVVLLDVNAASYPVEDESRHLLHIAATRAAHQLWLIATGEPSALVQGWDE